MQDTEPQAEGRTLDDFLGPADALIDALHLTMHLRFEGPPAESHEAVSRRLAEAGIVRPGRRFDDVVFEWACPVSGEILRLGGAMKVISAGGAVVTRGGSGLDVNLLHLLRTQLGTECPVGLDGGVNVVGPPEEDRTNLLGLQLDTVAGLIDAFLDACSLAAAAPVAASFWVSKAEFNRDLVRPGAPDLGRRLAAEPNPWHSVGRVRAYAASPGTELDGNLLTSTWFNDRADARIRHKFYAKTEGLLRTEVCYDSGEAVALGARLAGVAWPKGPEAGGAGVAGRLGLLAVASAPALDAMAAHLARLGEPELGLHELLAALAPLFRASAPPPPRRGGGRPCGDTREAAGEALRCLLSVGRFDASALRSNGTVRKALHRLAGEGVLLREGRGRAPLFVLPPAFARARAALWGAFWPGAGVGGSTAPSGARPRLPAAVPVPAALAASHRHAGAVMQ
jgi:hypothetical protein